MISQHIIHFLHRMCLDLHAAGHISEPGNLNCLLPRDLTTSIDPVIDHDPINDPSFVVSMPLDAVLRNIWLIKWLKN